MPFDTAATHQIDEASGLRIEDAFARVGHGHCYVSGGRVPTTFVSKDEAGDRFILHFPGIAADGGIYPVPSHGRAYRLTLVEKDCEAVLNETTRTTLRAFLADNEFEPDFAVAVAVNVLAGGMFCGGGGAEPEWTLRNAATPPERFINADGSHYFPVAA